MIVASDALDDMIKDGRVVAGSRVDLARSSIGMAVRAGARKPDISTVAALTRALLEAQSVAVSSSVSGNYFTNELFPQLGLADRLKGKCGGSRASVSAPSWRGATRRSGFSRSASCFPFRASTSSVRFRPRCSE